MNNLDLNLWDVLQYYKYLEKKAHVSIDDVMNKVTQEVGELIKADYNQDKIEMYKEAWDVLANLYSISEELSLNTSLELDADPNNQASHTKLMIMLWEWNTAVEWFRKRYSREEVSISEVEEITLSFVKEILNYSAPNSSIKEIIQQTTNKFESRVDKYKPEIDIKDYISEYSNFPKEWIDFKDISPLLESPEAFKYVCMEMIKHSKDAEVIVGLDSRWFLFWTYVAEKLWIPFIMLRKQWKLPGETIKQDYWLEYWNDTVELQIDSIKKWQKVSIIDDLLATWWTAKAAIDLVEKAWWEINNVSFVISLDEKELKENKARKELEKYNINSIVAYN